MTVIGHSTVGTDYAITDQILENEFDFIFFTGSSNGRYVLSKAAQYLTPVILELGTHIFYCLRAVQSFDCKTKGERTQS